MNGDFNLYIMQKYQIIFISQNFPYWCFDVSSIFVSENKNVAYKTIVDEQKQQQASFRKLICLDKVAKKYPNFYVKIVVNPF